MWGQLFPLCKRFPKGNFVISPQLCIAITVWTYLFGTLCIREITLFNTVNNTVWTCVSPHSVLSPYTTLSSFVLRSTLRMCANYLVNRGLLCHCPIHSSNFYLFSDSLGYYVLLTKVKRERPRSPNTQIPLI